MQMGATSKTVGSSMAQLLTAAAQGNDNYTGSAARETAGALQILMQSVRGVVATTEDRQLQTTLIESTHEVIDASAKLIEEAKKAVQNPNNPANQARLAQVSIRSRIRLCCVPFCILNTSLRLNFVALGHSIDS